MWVALIAVSLLCYVLLGVRLFRNFMATVHELSAAGERFGHRAHSATKNNIGSKCVKF